MTLVDGGTLIERARAGSYAIVAVNVSNLETTQGVLAAAEQALSPVLLQLSPGAIAYAGYRPLTRLVVDAAADAGGGGGVHPGHLRHLGVVRQALDAGF